MSKVKKYLGHEISFFVPNPKYVMSYSSAGGVERHGEGSQRCSVYGYETARELAKKVEKTFGDYEKPLSEYEIKTISETVCAHCGRNWTEDDSEYNGGCCDADQSAHNAAMEAA